MIVPSSSLRGWLSVGFGVALSASVLAGCGGGDGGEGGGGGGEPAPKWEPLPVPAQAWSHGDPSALEQQLLEQIQRARANPGGEIDLLLQVAGVPTAMKQFDVDEAQLRSDFKMYSPVPPLSFDARLMASARGHSEDMAANGFQEHTGSDGKTFDQRIDDAGYDWSFASENVFAYAESVSYCHAAFLIDWGNSEPGHRNAILDVDGKKRDVGISVVEDPASDAVGPLVVTQDFAMPASTPPGAQRFIVGVAYHDDNGNGAYDPGEGAGGLTVVPSSGDHHAVTSASGGFSIPTAADAGAVTVQLQDETTWVIDQKETTLAGENVKVDFALPAE